MVVVLELPWLEVVVVVTRASGTMLPAPVEQLWVQCTENLMLSPVRLRVLLVVGGCYPARSLDHVSLTVQLYAPLLCT